MKKLRYALFAVALACLPATARPVSYFVWDDQFINLNRVEIIECHEVHANDADIPFWTARRCGEFVEQLKKCLATNFPDDYRDHCINHGRGRKNE